MKKTKFIPEEGQWCLFYGGNWKQIILDRFSKMENIDDNYI